jgi:hypothetical protein
MTLLYTNGRVSSRKRKEISEKSYKREKSRDFLRQRQNNLVKGKKVGMDGRKVPYIEIAGMKRGMDRMYRGKIAGKDVIVRLGNRVSRRHFSDNKIYNMVLSYGETAFRKGQETFCIYNDRIGFIVAEVERNDIPVIRIDYIIENENVYE